MKKRFAECQPGRRKRGRSDRATAAAAREEEDLQPPSAVNKGFFKRLPAFIVLDK